MTKIKQSRIKEFQKWVDSKGGITQASQTIGYSYEWIRKCLEGETNISQKLAKAIVKDSPEIDLLTLLGYR